MILKPRRNSALFFFLLLLPPPFCAVSYIMRAENCRSGIPPLPPRSSLKRSKKRRAAAVVVKQKEVLCPQLFFFGSGNMCVYVCFREARRKKLSCPKKKMFQKEEDNFRGVKLSLFLTRPSVLFNLLFFPFMYIFRKRGRRLLFARFVISLPHISIPSLRFQVWQK